MRESGDEHMPFPTRWVTRHAATAAGPARGIPTGAKPTSQNFRLVHHRNEFVPAPGAQPPLRGRSCLTQFQIRHGFIASILVLVRISGLSAVKLEIAQKVRDIGMGVLRRRNCR